MLLVLAVCAAPVIASYFTYFVIRPEGRNNYADLISPSRTMPAALPLRNLQGQAVAVADLRRQWQLIAVATAVCDAACEQRLLLQRQVHQMLGRDRERLDKLWLVIDEAAPRPELLAGLTGGADPPHILRVPRAALEQWFQPAAGHALEDHLYIVDPMGEWMMRVPAQPDPMRLKKDLERLLRASAWWQSGKG
jgi:cytochrome oxidase Cu insertion factor (SCO1/SenC/PrrC family)